MEVALVRNANPAVAQETTKEVNVGYRFEIGVARANTIMLSLLSLKLLWKEISLV